jgi:glucose-1-phosphate adenylyltransferase
MFVLTQYNSESLNKHVNFTYKFDLFSPAFVNILAAEQTEDSPEWFQGTADAVRQSLRHFGNHRSKEVLILSGDQLYQMDYRKFLDSHRRQVADVTVAVTPVTAEQASSFGILKMNRQGRIVHFDEKPPKERLGDLVSEVPGLGPVYLASMGIYMFNRPLLETSVRDTAQPDFGRHVIPKLVPEARVQAYVYRGYWEDVGTIRSYYEANLALSRPVPPFDFYDFKRPVYTHPRFMPATKVERCVLEGVLVSEGCIVVDAEVRRALLGIRSRIGRGARVQDSLVLGADYYETPEESGRSAEQGLPPMGIGDDTVIERAIIDKNARIGRGVRILNEEGVQEKDGDGYYIREGIVCVPKNGVVRDGVVI